MNEFGMKAGAIALLTAVALFPWEKEYRSMSETTIRKRFEDGGKGDWKGAGSERMIGIGEERKWG